ncbi:histone deacetylase 6 isoform X2 [Anopheles nili]|uniref:histone deacetylase 6 isoform X2 n=1 Tax=Anopheles nili TaxID=185578 RepID=UPI00237AC67F|nr:histone deacetylase 6 isoform X2 [Anopheles nili]
MAIIRPPGHHAMTAEYNGYCFFNNVAIAAQHAIDNLGLSRILIVDWDVHHGQGTQRMFYSDPRILYFSIHRYEHGSFWPNLRESDFDYVGEGTGEGFNFNVPLNATGMTNGDYLAIWHQLLLPVATEGCMDLTPAFYSHLLSPLLSLANGRVAVVLEGGYCLESLAEGCVFTLKTLLGDPCPRLVEKLLPPSKSIQGSILDCIFSHRNYWKCLQLYDVYESLEEYNNINPQDNFHKVIKCYIDPETKSGCYETRNCYPVLSVEQQCRVQEHLSRLKMLTNINFPDTRVCYVYDELMLEHRNNNEKWHPEQPERIIKIIQSLTVDYQLTKRMKRLIGRLCTTDELRLVHDSKHINLIEEICESSMIQQTADQFTSIYFHPRTNDSARMAAGSVLEVVAEVLSGRARSGICVVRPPGHHAEPDSPHGFCIFNNVAIAARHALDYHGLQRVLIVDWDVHHGNGTQHIFESDPRVLYISVHRYDNGLFFPKSSDADYTVVGNGPAEGYNVNIPWNKKGMGDAEYVAAFHSIILPIAYEFDPELVLISAGFDAAIGDPLGGCRVTPEAYGHFTFWLSALASGRIVLCLEGGYNVNSISYAMAMCTKALLGDPLPALRLSFSQNSSEPSASCIETLHNVMKVQQKYWQAICFNKKLPNINSVKINADGFFDNSANFLQDSNNIPLNENVSTAQSNLVPLQLSSQKSAFKSAATHEACCSSNLRQKPLQSMTEYLESNLEALRNKEMFAVVPRKECPHLNLLNPASLPYSVDSQSLCKACGSEKENWICMICFEIYCGRYVKEHMIHHSTDFQNHLLVLSLSDISVWCYGCNAYIDHPILYGYKNLVHIDKFQETLIWSYDSNQLLDVAEEATSTQNIKKC